MNNDDFAHVLSYGGSGNGKSHLWSTSPLPRLIALFDSIGNARPYLLPFRNKRIREFGGIVNGKATIIETILSYDIEDTSLEKLLQKIWVFQVGDVSNPIGKSQFDVKIPLLEEELAKMGAKTFTFDSLTQYRILSRLTAKFVNPYPQRGEQEWANVTTNEIEQLAMTLIGLQCNVGCIAHVSDSMDSKGVRHTFVSAPGRMQNNLLGMFSDSWYHFADEEGNKLVQLTTRGEHLAKNTFGWTEDRPNNWPAIVDEAPAGKILWT